MATLPRPTKSPSASIIRPHSEFDAGINTSNAWTQHQSSGDLSDEESLHLEGADHSDRRPARALYDFEGKPEFRELCVSAGDELEVVKEELADGWSLVCDVEGEIGLLPRSYFIFTSEFSSAFEADVTSPSQAASSSKFRRMREASSGSITPRNSILNNKDASLAAAVPIMPQNTGEWNQWMFPSFRQSLLGGKSLNRFSSFVTSGAEEWVLKGKAADTTVIASAHERLGSILSEDDEEEQEELDLEKVRPRLLETDRHFVDSGHTWKSKVPPFKVLVHSPSKRTSILSGAYTVYNVTSMFELSPDYEVHPDTDSSQLPLPQSPTRITVQRRFSQFVILHTALTRRLPGIALPPLPEKQYAGRFSDDFVEARRGDLERYIRRIVRHPVARYAEVVTWFLSCESESEWKRLAPYHLSKAPAGPSFYAQVFHPAFNLDLEDAEEAVERFATHTRAVGKGVQGLRSIFGRVRESRLEMSKAERLLSYSLLSLITSKSLAATAQSPHISGIAEEEEEEEEEEEDSDPSSPTRHANIKPHLRFKGKGLMNEDGAWCWREGCQNCLSLTKSIQRTAETLQSVADLYDDHARRTQLATHESLKGVAHPAPIYEGVVSTHRSTLTRYREAGYEAQSDSNDDLAARCDRCETVLNTTMAEMETYHSQKVEDFEMLTKDHLDGEIALYEQVGIVYLAHIFVLNSSFSGTIKILARLKAARTPFDAPTASSIHSTTSSSISTSSSFSPLASSPSLSSHLEAHYTHIVRPPSPRKPSIYERELEAPRLTPAPLLQPCPHVFDSTPMRPVSVAIGGAVGGLLSGASRGGGYKGEGRGSVFSGLFW
ncbi:hypothetical protein J3R30DRAFT_3707813 [Lentinula aciculospora]|uniref:PX-domain-containing protein n=1 Tax=Lentinula aciculospora TaxID=153920 RepID=A0A9W9A6A1_9AGAR|nr:hypothetical protein J3R30DRAFT_3707813 [Lentinula aciculospora]